VRFDGDPACATVLGETIACPAVRRGRTGLWVDGAWLPVAARALWEPSRGPQAPLVAAHGGGYVLLPREGGAFPPAGPAAQGAPPLRLPAGIYAALVRTGRGLFALAPGDPPRFVAVL
jgi:hypothetical protein